MQKAFLIWKFALIHSKHMNSQYDIIKQMYGWLFMLQDSVAIFPLIVYVSGFVASVGMRPVNSLLGRKASYQGFYFNLLSTYLNYPTLSIFQSNLDCQLNELFCFGNSISMKNYLIILIKYNIPFFLFEVAKLYFSYTCTRYNIYSCIHLQDLPSWYEFLGFSGNICIRSDVWYWCLCVDLLSEWRQCQAGVWSSGPPGTRGIHHVGDLPSHDLWPDCKQRGRFTTTGDMGVQ